MAPHPLDALSIRETEQARALLLELYPDTLISFREIFLEEPSKKELRPYLNAEHAAQPLPRLHRRALAQYDVIGAGKEPEFHESVLDLTARTRISFTVVAKEQFAALTLSEFDVLVEVCAESKLYQDALREICLPDGFEVVLEPWPYGGLLPDDEPRRYFQGLCFARDTRSGNADSNFYAFPLPIIPVMDYGRREVIRIDRLATGGKGDGLEPVGKRQNYRAVDHCRAAEYVPELLSKGPRRDLKPLSVVQPEGPSFSVDGNLVQWQGWRFRIGFNPREGAVLHDMHFMGRSVMYRLSFSEMSVPYADARWPFARKQAFDFGDGGAGNFANNLALGCDCLGVIKYFDGITTGPDGTAEVAPNVTCLHEQDNGIGWKHTNWRTGRAVVTRNRELVVQFIITLANYEYVFAYKLDQAGGITIETRATGIVNVVNIDANKTSDYGTIVGPGALAQNHQHLFAFRMDFAIDGDKNSVVTEESHTVPMNPETNPYGNYYQVRHKTMERSGWIDASGKDNRVIKVVNPSRINPISKQPVGYKFTPQGTQLILAAPGSIQEQRAQFARHHVWVTKHKEGELFAAGRYTLQSTKESGGVADAAARDENVQNDDVVVWNVFGLTHNPRCEDWPVMPVEIHQLHIKPVNFFTQNPSLDVPSSKDNVSVLTEGAGFGVCCEAKKLTAASL